MQEKPVWKSLVVVFSRAEVVSVSDRVRLNRFFLDEPEIERLNAALGLFEKAAEAESGGAVDVRYEVRVDPTPVRRYANLRPDGSADPVWEALPQRFNEAAFDSDDKTDRGPYSGVFVVDAQPGAWVKGSALATRYGVLHQRFGTPTAMLSMLPTNQGEGAEALAQDFLGAWRAQVAMRSGRPVGEGEPFWSSVPAPGQPTVPGPAVTAFLNTFAPLGAPGLGIFQTPQPIETENGAGVSVKLTPGLLEGEVTLVSDLPTRPSGADLLQFWVRTNSSAPLEIRIGDGSQRVGIGFVEAADPQMFASPQRYLSVPSDQTWRLVRVRLAKDEAVTRVRLGVPLAARAAESRVRPNTQIEFAGWSFVSQGDETPNELPAEIQTLRDLLTSSASGAVGLLESPDTGTLVAALHRLAYGPELPPVSAAPRLAQLARSAQPAVAIHAVRALERLNTDKVAVDALRYALDIGPFEHARFGAAVAVGANPTAATAPALATMLTASEWSTRLEAVKGLAKVRTRDTNFILLAMLPDREATVRRAIIESVDLSLELANRRLLFAAVNDPVETVRIAAVLRLVKDGQGTFRTEALAAIREESPFVRASLLEFIERNPAEDLRRTVLLGLGDRDPRVRLRAVAALAKQPGTLRREELAQVLNDGNADVRAAAEALARERGI